MRCCGHGYGCLGSVRWMLIFSLSWGHQGLAQHVEARQTVPKAAPLPSLPAGPEGRARPKQPVLSVLRVCLGLAGWLERQASMEQDGKGLGEAASGPCRSASGEPGGPGPRSHCAQSPQPAGVPHPPCCLGPSPRREPACWLGGAKRGGVDSPRAQRRSGPEAAAQALPDCRPVRDGTGVWGPVCFPVKSFTFFKNNLQGIA